MSMSLNPNRHILHIGVAVVAIAASPVTASAQALFEFNQPAQSMPDALRKVGAKANVSIAFDPAVVRGKQAPALRGSFTALEAITRLLGGETLQVRLGGNGGFVVERRIPGEADAGRAAADTDESAAILVTGSRIRNIEETASPITRYSRQDILTSTRTDLSGFLETLPQNVTGGALSLTPDGIFGSGSGRFLSLAGATTPNLRGLGAGSTLTLVNGHRVATSAGSAFVDIGVIPLNAIERIDIVPDGASAVYGSDAVGGVFNVILRDTLDGAETNLSYEISDGGDYSHFEASQSLGAAWGSGSVLVSGRYGEREPLEARDRSFARDVGTYDRAGVVLRPQLYPDERNYSGFLAAKQEIAPWLKANVDGWLSRREQQQVYGTIASFITADSVSKQLSLNGALSATLSPDYTVDVSFGHSKTNDLVQQSNYTQAAGRNYGIDVRDRSTLDYIAANTNGSLFALPGGDLAYALGGELRGEKFHRAITGSTNRITDVSRTIRSAYGELLVPIVGAGNEGGFIRRASLSLAGRYDSYSDVGHSLNGKIGLVVEAPAGFKLRGTYSTAFRAPTLSDLASQGAYSVVGISDLFASPDRAGTANTILLQGYNGALRPEEADVFTIGADFAPVFAPGLSASATYFNYDYRDRLTLPPFDTSILTKPDVFGDVFQKVTSAAQVGAILDAARAAGRPITIYDPSLPLASYEYIIDLTFRNIAAQQVRGLDFDIRYRFPVGSFNLQASVAGTYVIDFKRQISATSQSADYVSLFGEAPRLKLRGQLVASAGAFGATASVSHVSGFFNTNVVNRPATESFTTLDLDLRYRFEKGALGGQTTLALSVRNLLDAAPPFVERAAGVPDYDPANANPLGRVLAVRLSHTW
jgi:iron complex outermembrane receptor protein